MINFGLTGTRDCDVVYVNTGALHGYLLGKCSKLCQLGTGGVLGSSKVISRSTGKKHVVCCQPDLPASRGVLKCLPASQPIHFFLPASRPCVFIKFASQPEIFRNCQLGSCQPEHEVLSLPAGKVASRPVWYPCFVKSYSCDI